MEHCKIIAVGDNVCDKYLSRGKMYPGGQCVNTCVYVKMNNMESAYLGKYGDDEVAACVQDTLKEIGIDDSHCRRYEGENGFALVTLKETDRVCLEGENSIPKRKIILDKKKELLEEKLLEVQDCIDYINSKQQFYDDVLSGKIKYKSNLIIVDDEKV